MNQLNSVILEGQVGIVTEGKPGSITCPVTSDRTSSDTKIIIDVRAYDKLVPGFVALKPGQTIRVVGRLAEFHDTVVLIAEHMEPMPIKK